MKKKSFFFSRIVVLVLMMAMLAGCGRKAPQQLTAETSTEISAVTATLSASADTSTESTSTLEDVDSSSASIVEDITIAEKGESSAPPSIDEDGVYTSKEDVALYLHTYGKLPGNFITKKAAKKLGWSGGSLEDYAPGMCIGGDYFGNYEGLLPEDKEYHECDIDTLGKKSRGPKRIIYSDDGYIYYTEDHYESFELLYAP